MIKVKLITLGSIDPNLKIDIFNKWKSKIFKLDGLIENYPLRIDSDLPGWQYSDEILRNHLPSFEADYLLAITNIPLEKDWYSRRVGSNKVIFTFHEIKNYLTFYNIPLENAILKILYSYSLVFCESGNRIPTVEERTDFLHDETRGCLYDMNGIKSDLIQSCDNPIICDECVERLKKSSKVSTQFIETALKEIKKIKKPIYYRIEELVKRKPITSLFISSIFIILLGVVSSVIAYWIL